MKIDSHESPILYRLDDNASSFSSHLNQIFVVREGYTLVVTKSFMQISSETKILLQCS